LQAIKSYDLDDYCHIIIGKVCDFTNGAESPPAPRPTSYMERGLARESLSDPPLHDMFGSAVPLGSSRLSALAVMMADFQAQMMEEVCKAGGDDANYMMKPEVIRRPLNSTITPTHPVCSDVRNVGTRTVLPIF
jgi:hypothetical protein